MKSHAAAVSASPLSATIHSEPPPTWTPGVSPGPGIGPTPMSASVRPGAIPPPSAAITLPSAADVPIVIAPGVAGSIIFKNASWPPGLSPTAAARVGPRIDDPAEARRTGVDDGLRRGAEVVERHGRNVRIEAGRLEPLAV